MTTTDPRRHVAQYRIDRDIPADERPYVDGVGGDEAGNHAGEPTMSPTGTPHAAGRMTNRAQWVDTIIDQAVARGEFDDLPLAGKPIPGLGSRPDPDWWLKGFVAREHISGVLPEALQLRTDDAALDGQLDRLRDEAWVREDLEAFNARIIAARRQLQGGPPVVTPLRDVELELERWRQRRRDAVQAARERAQAEQAEPSDAATHRWLRRPHRG